MKYIIWILILGIFTWIITYNIPRKYRIRPCTGRNWNKAFPKTSKVEIRKFLVLFTSAFAFSSKNKLKFKPEDKILDIYQTLYPYQWMADSLEIEILAEDLEAEYGINLNSLWHDDLTLGEIFYKTTTKNHEASLLKFK